LLCKMKSLESETLDQILSNIKIKGQITSSREYN